MNFRGSHILSVGQFDRSDLNRVLDVAAKMEPFATQRCRTNVLDGCVLANLFFEPSTRTRISFGAAFNRLGGRVCDTTGFQFSSIIKGESLFDTAKVISGYVDVAVMRHPVAGSVAEFASASRIPVINGGDGPGEHPTQALLDIYTIQKELGQKLDQVPGLRVAMVGDLKFGRTVHSLSRLLSLFDHVSLILVSPEELRMPVEIIQDCRGRGVQIEETDDLFQGIEDVDVVYMTRVQEERFASPEEAERHRGRFVLDRSTFQKHCRANTVLMHPLPRDSRPGARELSDELNTLPELAIFRQAENGIPVRMALFALVLGVEQEVEKTSKPVPWFVPDRSGARGE
jgi:aspartate carbamoyltransferase catalytic subunit